MSKYYWLVESHKVLKHDLLQLMLNYYMASIKWPTFLPLLNKYQRTVIFELAGASFRGRPEQLSQYVYYLGVLLDRAVEADYG